MATTKNIYSLPLKKEDIAFAASDERAHFKHLKHAIDFPLPEGTKIIAAKEGVVTDIKQDSNEGGHEKKYEDIKYLNYITILHNNFEFSQYAHLKHNGALVKKGQTVKTGQVIGLSGNTGDSTEPHLHFHVIKLNTTKVGWETLKIKFKEKLKILRF
jgi:murein DD-endopeptidase MepM/ murein hydrolase activator NlpD